MIAVASYAREYVWPDFTCATQVQGAYAKMAVDASGISREYLCMYVQSCRIRHLTTVKESLMSQYKRPGLFWILFIRSFLLRSVLSVFVWSSHNTSSIHLLQTCRVIMSANLVLLILAMLLLSFLGDSARLLPTAEGNGNGIAAAVEEPGMHEQEIYPRKLWARLDYPSPGTHPGNPHEHQLEENVDYYPPRNHNDSPPAHKHIPSNEDRPERHLVDALDYVPARTHTPSPVH
ncbi:uncharacterized protein LOC9661910 isoform X2 [Selaginella moellendorffii]|uniref:uncharacterized protein LOC9661910 isoform X2 n=1 Tax=Selaginella moellendorffii TaxID=88036 RepID=UPI000D1CB0E1|nr:uncharacterized protein LOC9661910 isoform X2 [Selaginella moellendorffii]|eukprot:XP_024543554.1 uncharacterized protein LOC9661910 isoform X2 [Selaginella moellendorffii]